MDLAIFTLRSAASAIVDPAIAPTLMILALILYFQNRKTALMQKAIVGESLNSPLELTASQVVLGILGGVIGSLLLVYSGAMFDENSGIYMIFILSILLMMFKPRFICFSYSGAVIGALSLIMNDLAVMVQGKPLVNGALRIDITALMTLVGILHIVEGMLVSIDGDRGAIPVFTNNNGKIAGGFAFKRYWPIPIVIILVTVINQSTGGGDTTTLSTPDWWPLINSPYALQILKGAAVALAPFYAILGYNSMTFTRNKRQKAVSSGLGIMLYGAVLTAVAQLAAYNIFLKIFVLVFAPLAHEFMLREQSYRELKNSPKYVSEDEGIMVLEVAPNSPAAVMGIRSGDKLMEINNIKIDDEKDVLDSIKSTFNKIVVKIKLVDGSEKELNYANFSAGQRLGVVFVPRHVPKDSLVMGYEDMKFKDFLDKISGDEDSTGGADNSDNDENYDKDSNDDGKGTGSSGSEDAGNNNGSSGSEDSGSSRDDDEAGNGGKQ